MKILVIFTTDFTLDGISNNTMSYYKYMDKEQLKIDYVCTNKDVPTKWVELLKNNGSQLHILPSRKKHLIKYYFSLIKLIKKNKYDIVHAHGNSATLFFEMSAAFFAGVKIRIAHSRNTKCSHNKADKLLRPGFYLFCNKRFACGEEAGKWLFKNRDFLVIKNGNDCEKFAFSNEKRKLMREKYNLSDDDIALLNVGSVNSQKNQTYLLQILKELVKTKTNIRLFICGVVGDEALYNDLKNYINDNNLNDYVIFTGGIDNVDEMYSLGDCFVFPSLYEGLPNALIEAQISGIKCVVSNTITDEACICDNVVKIGIDEENLHSWCKEILSCSCNREVTSQNNILILRQKDMDIKFNAQKLVDIYKTFYNQRLEKANEK